MISIRTDLAVEAKEIYEKQTKSKIPGVEIKEHRDGFIKITEVKIVSDQGEELMGKPKGTYTTLEIPEISGYDQEYLEEVSRVFSKALIPLTKLDKSMTVLVVGLGNWNVTPDALGPKVVEKVMITRHLKQFVPDSIDEGIRPVCGIAPGVLGITGIETGEIIKSVVDKIKPNLVICIDALASRNLERINRTIQIGTTGISPGAGVKNKRMEISEKTLGVPVIAIGVPTVVDAATIANDTIDMVLDEMMNQAKTGEKFYNMLKELDRNEKQKMIKEILNPYVGDLMVTPKDVDAVIDNVSKIISMGVNLTLQPALELNDINSYLN